MGVGGGCGSERNAREYVLVNHAAGTGVYFIVVGNATVGFNFPDMGWKAFFFK